MGTKSPVISVIIPIHRPSIVLSKIRTNLATAKIPIETLFVVNNPSPDLSLASEVPYEKVLYSSPPGRGHAFYKGTQHAKGDVIFLLHADTIPPVGWDTAILQILENPEVVGGCFSLEYDQYKWYLRYGTIFMDLVIRSTGELYGDRGMFVRTSVLKACQRALEVPLFEDVRLSKCMRSYGRKVLLKEKVTANAQEFLKYGMIGNIRRFVMCRLWYAVGAAPHQLYSAYYR
jgi:cellulose synthase/poly-beta-1,6-N-acetylglucosamine synthase-like glycosyltransferase